MSIEKHRTATLKIHDSGYEVLQITARPEVVAAFTAALATARDYGAQRIQVIQRFTDKTVSADFPLSSTVITERPRGAGTSDGEDLATTMVKTLHEFGAIILNADGEPVLAGTETAG